MKKSAFIFIILSCYIKKICFILALTVIIAGCDRKNDDYDAYSERNKFCSFLNAENIDQTIPIINRFLSRLPAGLDVEQKLLELEAWLRPCPCIIDVAVFNENEIFISFYENRVEKKFVLDIAMAAPVQVTGYREYIEQEPEPPEIIDPPIEIPFSEYFIAYCQWKNLMYNNREIIIINSDNELDNYITCTKESYTVIDFSKYTLLLASGRSNGMPVEFAYITFLKNAANEYTLSIIIKYGIHRGSKRWCISILVPKISNQAFVKLNFYQSQSTNVLYVPNELMIQLKEGVDAMEFAVSHQGITPKELLYRNINVWIFKTDGTKELNVLISKLSQDDRVIFVYYNYE